MHWRRGWAVISIAVTVLMAATQPEAIADTSAARADFLAMVARVLPTQGMIEAATVPAKGWGEIRTALDFGTGEWYWLTQDIVMLGDATGVLHWGDTGRGGLKPMGKPSSHDSKYPQVIVSSLIPDVLLWLSHRYPSVVHEVHRTDGGFEALLRFDGYSHERTQQIKVEVGDDGVVRRAWSANMPRSLPIEYSPETTLGRPRVSAHPAESWRIASVEASPASVPGTFKPERIESIGEIVKMNMAKAQAAANAGTPGGSSNGSSDAEGNGATPAGSANEASATPFLPAPGARWRWPLAGAGMTLLVVGAGVLWWKRRR